MSILDDKMARLLAAAIELRAAAIDHAEYLATTSPGPGHEGNSLATIQKLARIGEITLRAGINLESNCDIAVNNATFEHGPAAVSEAIKKGERLGKSDCPCTDCVTERRALEQPEIDAAPN